MGARITADEIDILIFFWDPMSSQPHDPDVKALLRMTVIYNIPTACNRASADYMISSPLFEDKEYTRIIKDYTPYMNREF
jgi:methylglyoxal synthase